MVLFLKWSDWLAKAVADEASWAGVAAKKPYDHLDVNAAKGFSDNVLEVAMTHGKAALLVVETSGGDKLLRFLHNLRVVKDGDGSFGIIGVSGLKSTTTFKFISEEKMEETFKRGNRRFKIPPAKLLCLADSATDFKALKGANDHLEHFMVR